MRLLVILALFGSIALTRADGFDGVLPGRTGISAFALREDVSFWLRRRVGMFSEAVVVEPRKWMRVHHFNELHMRLFVPVVVRAHARLAIISPADSEVRVSSGRLTHFRCEDASGKDLPLESPVASVFQYVVDVEYEGKVPAQIFVQLNAKLNLDLRPGDIVACRRFYIPGTFSFTERHIWLHVFSGPMEIAVRDLENGRTINPTANGAFPVSTSRKWGILVLKDGSSHAMRN